MLILLLNCLVREQIQRNLHCESTCTVSSCRCLGRLFSLIRMRGMIWTQRSSLYTEYSVHTFGLSREIVLCCQQFVSGRLGSSCVIVPAADSAALLYCIVQAISWSARPPVCPWRAGVPTSPWAAAATLSLLIQCPGTAHSCRSSPFWRIFRAQQLRTVVFNPRRGRQDIRTNQIKLFNINPIKKKNSNQIFISTDEIVLVHFK